MTWQEIVALLVWYASLFLICWFTCTAIMMLADAATLSMSGSFAGHGVWNATIEADLIAANISSSGWEIIAGGMA